ncbi:MULTISPECIES: hypothetical protein [unclassified Paenibacillus]|uniref:hypothetical protein n=1 Tax=unclassified Paenibacillus TaxID=185978 RepID=UPI001AE2A0E3|nr:MULTISPECIES: hypothetical protein [unclassified Paenibacillus]MBP1154388.1 hypothetical protein [Paenibacillus sp. PvP091]MBP1170228.1 hypothetical protein [Paenibacillus sp. PvR098]MBP2441256.1 hypothetical protein [Paenibacillus sp. PvP052]
MSMRLEEPNLSGLAQELETFIHHVTRDEEPKELQTYIEVIKGIMLKHINPPHES